MRLLWRYARQRREIQKSKDTLKCACTPVACARSFFEVLGPSAHAILEFQLRPLQKLWCYFCSPPELRIITSPVDAGRYVRPLHKQDFSKHFLYIICLDAYWVHFIWNRCPQSLSRLWFIAGLRLIRLHSSFINYHSCSWYSVLVLLIMCRNLLSVIAQNPAQLNSAHKSPKRKEKKNRANRKEDSR